MRLESESYPLVFQFSQIYLGGGAIGFLVISVYIVQLTWAECPVAEFMNVQFH
jgi:hypothetical protein